MKQTILHAQHEALGAKLVDFAGYDMPLNYPTGVLAEHLHTRKHAGIFDISHMGRFLVSGPDALPFLQHVLTNNVASLDLLQAQYTFIPNAAGGAMDDAYLYRFWEKEYLLVVNASNAEKDLAHLTAHLGGFDATITDRTEEIGMVSVQGPASREILMELFKGQMLTEPLKNELNILDARRHGDLGREDRLHRRRARLRALLAGCRHAGPVGKTDRPRRGADGSRRARHAAA